VKSNEVWGTHDIVAIMDEQDEDLPEGIREKKRILIPNFSFNSETPKNKLPELMQKWLESSLGKNLRMW
jgi:hypothetical protein